MNYGVLLWPHANARYQAESFRLARAELTILLARACPGALVAGVENPDFNLLQFTVPAPLTQDQIDLIARHSLLYVLFEVEGELLRPVAGRARTYLLPDLPGVLKYKGKTNEFFTAFTINLALYASAHWAGSEGRLRFADPMCARGTALFQAANRGWDAYGTDLAGAEIKELTQYFKRYLEYHKIKHSAVRESCTIQGAKAIPVNSFSYADTPEAYKSGEKAVLRAAEGDCAAIGAIAGRAKYHLMACDLPYGVQHAPGGAPLEKLLARALPVWRDALLPGGAVALSFNSNIIKLETIRKIMEDSGYMVMRTGPWDGFSHWVEQAVERDVAACVRPGAL